jgi:prophage regulatory protein
MKQTKSKLRPQLSITPSVPTEKILKINDVISITNLSRSSIYRLAADSSSMFPKPVKLSIRASGWKLSAITQWLSSLQTAS